MNIQEQINRLMSNCDTVNIIISGVTCSGKTTLANEIRDYFLGTCSVAIVSQDDYFKNLLDIPKVAQGYLTDSIEAFHIEEFKCDVERLLKDSVVVMPTYDISTNTRISKNKVTRVGKINIFEGLHTIYLLDNLDNSIKIYIDVGMDTCLKRRIQRDTSKFNIPEERIREYWKDCITPMCEKYIFPQIKSADIVINSNSSKK